MVKSARKLIGATNPLEAEAGTIRGDLAIQTGRNVVHGSDSPENGEREAGQPPFWVHSVPPCTCDLPAVHASNLSALYACVIMSKVHGMSPNWMLCLHAALWFGEDDAQVQWQPSLAPWLTE